MSNHHIHISPFLMFCDLTDREIPLFNHQDGWALWPHPLVSTQGPLQTQYFPSKWHRPFAIRSLLTSCARPLGREYSLIQMRKHYRQFGKRNSRGRHRAIQLGPRLMTHLMPMPLQFYRERQLLRRGKIQKREVIRY